MRTVHRRMVLAAIVVASIIFLSGCSKSGGGSPTSPSTPPPPTVSVNPSAVTLTPEGEPKTISIAAQSAWSINKDASWLIVSPMAGSGPGNVEVKGQPNTSPTPRTATFTISGVTVSVTQEEKTYAPPAGVRQELWAMACSNNGRMRYPDAVHLLPPAGDAQTQANFAAVAKEMNGLSSIPVDVVSSPVATGATVTMAVVPGQVCGAYGQTAACTYMTPDSSGRLTGGRMEFASINVMRDFTAGLREGLRTLGITGVSPFPGLFAQQPSSLTEEERTMIRARTEVPRLGLCGS